MDSFYIYLWSISGDIKSIAIALAFVLVLFYVILGIYRTVTKSWAEDTEAHLKSVIEEEKAKDLKDKCVSTIHYAESSIVNNTAAESLYKKFPRALMIVSILVSFLIPAKRDMALMYLVPRIKESPLIQKEIPELYEAGMKALRSITKEGKKK